MITVLTGLWVKFHLRFFVPVDILGRLGPKALRIALPARVDLVVATRAGVHGAVLSFFILDYSGLVLDSPPRKAC